jgi:hypothetical protein
MVIISRTFRHKKMSILLLSCSSIFSMNIPINPLINTPITPPINPPMVTNTASTLESLASTLENLTSALESLTPLATQVSQISSKALDDYSRTLDIIQKMDPAAMDKLLATIEKTLPFAQQGTQNYTRTLDIVEKMDQNAITIFLDKSLNTTQKKCTETASHTIFSLAGGLPFCYYGAKLLHDGVIQLINGKPNEPNNGIVLCFCGAGALLLGTGMIFHQQILNMFGYGI